MEMRNYIIRNSTEVNTVMKIIGIDVQTRGLAVAVINLFGDAPDSAWLPLDGIDHVSEVLTNFPLFTDEQIQETAIGIDAPRRPLAVPRPWYWDSRHQNWRPRRRNERGFGRHCEVILRAHGLANPQWTPIDNEVPEWMKIGFNLYRLLDCYKHLYEVFPSASYKQLCEQGMLCQVNLKCFVMGTKDMLDAYIAAYTVREYLCQRGCAIGDGDSLGAIIMPRQILQPIEKVMQWPAN